ncbi:hypothetical protein BGW42_008368, partial [Actinomortierella wolfii]
MQLSGPSTRTTSCDHFYTTEEKDFTAKEYLFEGITGYLYTEKYVETVALHQWYSPTTNDNFYTIDEPSERTSEDGYDYQGVVGF